MDNHRPSDSLPAMRGPWCLIALMFALPIAAGCKGNKYEQPEWQKLPASYDPKGLDLTFNTKNLEAFNSLSDAERQQQVEAMVAAPGSFKGQALYESVEELSEQISDHQYGRYVVTASVPDPVLFEIQIDYLLFSDTKLISGLAPKTPIEFTGTLAELHYQNQSKPRKLELKVKLTSANALKD